MTIVPKGSLVLVSGANGFIAIHVVQTLLDRGYAVRGTVRDERKAGYLRKTFSAFSDKLEIVVVEDITKVYLILDVKCVLYIDKTSRKTRLITPLKA